MLYIVPTPIGNLGDMSYRAIEVLGQVSQILAEDTRTSKKLLSHYKIDTPVRSYHAHNEHKLVEGLVAELKERDMALISDAGMPGISDPGFLLIRACRDAEVELTVLPGPAAVVTALVASGLPSDRFHYEGFLPHKKGRQTRWRYLQTLDSTIVLYESTHRILKVLKEIDAYLGAARPVALCKELTKLHEQILRGSALEIHERLLAEPRLQKGEHVVVIGTE